MLKDGHLSLSEYQYNAVRVFDQTPAEYRVVNVTDTQTITEDAVFTKRSLERLRQFVRHVNEGGPDVQGAAFATFNGDLMHGASPKAFRAEYVAVEFAREAHEAMLALKDLTLPIFLTTGNHDGIASTGTVPPVDQALAATGLTDSLHKVWEAVPGPKAWPGFSWSDFEAYKARTRDYPGGVPLDVFSGAHVRRAGAKTIGESFVPVARSARNQIMTDGFYVWQKTFGPTYFAWSFGPTHYVSLNSYELRQHLRTGWGMYTPNYGGSLSPVQLEWAARELDEAKKRDRDVVLVMHHDPRGGHKDDHELRVDSGYLFEQRSFEGMTDVFMQGFQDMYLTPFVCSKVPKFAVLFPDGNTGERCVHDGLADWMRPDERFDCAAADRTPSGTCDPNKLDPASPQFHGLVYSNVDLLERLSQNPNVRTVLMGHTHENALGVVREGEALVPAKISLDDATVRAVVASELQHPLRARIEAGLQHRSLEDMTADDIQRRLVRFASQYERTMQTRSTKLTGSGREVVWLHTASTADVQGEKHIGFAVLRVAAKNDARHYPRPQINQFTIVRNVDGAFHPALEVAIDRTRSLSETAPENPIAHATY